MKKKFYNNSEVEFKETIETLKSLPKISAPDNFEYNLMVKINNGNFELKSEPKKKSILWKILPAPAVVAAAIMAFFLIPEETIDSNNLFQFSPIQVIDSAKQAQLSAKSSSLTIQNKDLGKENISENKSELNSGSEKIFRMKVQPNDVAVKEKMNVPFDPEKEVEVDNYIDGKTVNGQSNSPASLVSGGDKSNSFEGFIIKNKDEKDSLLKSTVKQDSLTTNSKLKQKK